MKKVKIFLGILLGWVALSPMLAYAAKTTYIYSDRRFHFVKREELGKKDLKERGEVNHPYEFTELQLREMLSRVQVNRKVLFKKEVEESHVFNQTAMEFLVPHLVTAFKEATPNENVIFSFVAKKPTFVFRDDRITIASAWVQNGFLHLEFKKLLAKLAVTNYDKLGDVSKAINRAEGLRVALELGEGQQFGKTTEEILLPVPTAAVAVAAAQTEEKKAEEAKPKMKEAKVVAPKEELKSQKVETTSPVSSSAEAKLEEIKKLYDKKLITKKEYEQKRKEVLDDL